MVLTFIDYIYIYNSYYNNGYEHEQTVRITQSHILVNPYNVWPTTVFSPDANVFTIKNGCFKGKRYLITEKSVTPDKGWMPHIPIDKKLKYLCQYELTNTVKNIIMGPRQTSIQVIEYTSDDKFTYSIINPLNSYKFIGSRHGPLHGDIIIDYDNDGEDFEDKYRPNKFVGGDICIDTIYKDTMVGGVPDIGRKEWMEKSKDMSDAKI